MEERLIDGGMLPAYPERNFARGRLTELLRCNEFSRDRSEHCADPKRRQAGDGGFQDLELEIHLSCATQRDIASANAPDLVEPKLTQRRDVVLRMVLLQDIAVYCALFGMPHGDGNQNRARAFG